ncbi:LysR family transcriptional regulator [Sporanaerobium hydrogeniformans]|uniref:LysR family transcriptional regulator n=1 Tax=Sporanaerobium hydrogeniformans TaxID=3072179 RepID=A0AC61DDQ9_9FIRM|nr:LysR family transcriptional regulator [Sporanaerobium hydrogeniformans]PHV71404.1 LysR family transcriptional regulator [Sporanaerobium hydrogeniformans]
MTIRHLKIFITVAECGKMRKAAELLYISQPTVSQAIAELEQYYGVKLFERLAQKIYLTVSGKQLLSYARHIVEDFENLDLAMKFVGSKARIRLGGSVSVGSCFFEPLMSEAEKLIPGLDLRVVINNTEYIEKRLLVSELDLAIVEGVVQSTDLMRSQLQMDELVIVVGKGHPFYTREEIHLTELEGENYIAREDGSTLRNQYELLLIEHNIRLEHKWSSSNIEPIKKAVIGGKGLAILSKLIIQKEIQEGLLKVIPVKGIQVTREIQLIYHKDKFISPQLNQFIELIKRMIK